jgi:iron complex outermembrane receptor protein
VNNLFDTYPDATPDTLNSNGLTAFSRYSPFGFNGRFVYGRLGWNW